MINQFITVFLLFSTLLISSAHASQFDDAVEAYRLGDYAEAYCTLRPMAEGGNADAQYNIGWMYRNGYGLRTDDSKALDWWLQASEKGHVDASFSIGEMYSLGDGKISKDLNLAIDYYLRAALHGHEDAVSRLKLMMMGNGKTIRNRLNVIVDKYAGLFGQKRVVKAKILNARIGPSTDKGIVTKLMQGQIVLELLKKGKWSHVAILGDTTINRVVWVYNPLIEAPMIEAPIQNK